MTEECECSVGREVWRMVSGRVGKMVRWRPDRPTSLAVKAFWLGFGLVLLDVLFMITVMAFFPPNLITVPIIILLILGALAIVIVVTEAYEKCREQCRGTWW